MGDFDLDAEVRDHAGRRDITDAVHRYMRGLDRLEAELQRSPFHEDAHVNAGLAAGGRDDVVACCQEFLGERRASHQKLGQVRIGMAGPDSADGECYFQAWHESRDEDGAPRDLFISGRYIDLYACREGEWRIAKRRLVADWVTDSRADHCFFDQEGVHRRARRGKDFSEKRDWPEA